MEPKLGALGQIAMSTADADRAEKFYGETLGLKKLFRFGTLVFFDLGGPRLMLEGGSEGRQTDFGASSVLYFRCNDIGKDTAALKSRGVAFTHEPHLISRQPDHDLWMSFFKDPDGHMLALMHEAPKGYRPA